jgi:hypothetical protein
MQEQKASLHPNTSLAPNHGRGRLLIKVIEARNLIKEGEGKRYCVVQFEGNEFITKDANYVKDPDRKYPIWQHEAVLYYFNLTK